MAPLSDIVWIYLGIVGTFYAVLAVKSVLKLSVCSICAAVSASWLVLLALRTFGWHENTALLALLMGMSAVGGYYLWERHARSEQLIFRLPILLTLAVLAWGVVMLQFDLALLVLIASVWLVHGMLYAYRNNPTIKPRVDKIIACCSNW
jgi:hypothetical protein